MHHLKEYASTINNQSFEGAISGLETLKQSLLSKTREGERGLPGEGSRLYGHVIGISFLFFNPPN